MSVANYKLMGTKSENKLDREHGAELCMSNPSHLKLKCAFRVLDYKKARLAVSMTQNQMQMDRQGND